MIFVCCSGPPSYNEVVPLLKENSNSSSIGLSGSTASGYGSRAPNKSSFPANQDHTIDRGSKIQASGDVETRGSDPGERDKSGEHKLKDFQLIRVPQKAVSIYNIKL